MTVDELAEEIRHVWSNRTLGAGALAEGLIPFISRERADYINRCTRPIVGIDLRTPQEVFDIMRSRLLGN